MSALGPISPQTVKTGINIGILLLIGVILIQAFAGVGQSVSSNFTVDTSKNDTISQIYTTLNDAIGQGAKFLGPVITIGLAFIVLVILIYLSRVAT